MPLPHEGFDPSEASVTWSVLRAGGHDVVFATPDGAPAAADPIMLTGEGLDPWGVVPAFQQIRVVGLILRANRAAREAYLRMIADPAYRKPLRYEEAACDVFDALMLPGGHAKSMRPFLENETLQSRVAEFFDANKPVAAICHGVVLAARSVSQRTGRSVLHGRKTTSLTWQLEGKAASTGRIVRFWDPTYYRTYTESAGEPPGYWSVQAEVTRNLARVEDYLEPDPSKPDYGKKISGLQRDTLTDARPAFVVQDGNYISARWPGDAHTFAKTFSALLR